MAEVTDIHLYGDGGAITFRVAGSGVDGSYRLQSPWQQSTRPLLRNGVQLGIGSADEAGVLAILRDWLSHALAVQAKGPPDESEGIPARIVWLEGMASVRHIHYVVRELEGRQPASYP